MSNHHDSGYKRLFSHPEMVRDLLRDWVDGEWIQDADFSTLERINASYVADNHKQRHDDMVWRVKIKENWVWVYSLLEFQSEPDPWMALRMLVYMGLLAQDLINRKELIHGKLPPILPLVLYNGKAVWNAPLNIADLFIHPPRGLERYLPHFIYFLIDEARLKLNGSDTVRNAVEALFRLENSRTRQDFLAILIALKDLLQDPEHAPLRRAFSFLVKKFLRRRVGAHTIPSIESINDLLEDSAMLQENINRWFDEATNEGRRQGKQEGKQEGRLEGKQEGRLEGEVNFLMKLLKRRFGPLPLEIVLRVQNASAEQLEAWGEAVLFAPSLAAVFEDPVQH